MRQILRPRWVWMTLGLGICAVVFRALMIEPLSLSWTWRSLAFIALGSLEELFPYFVASGFYFALPRKPTRYFLTGITTATWISMLVDRVYFQATFFRVNITLIKNISWATIGFFFRDPGQTMLVVLVFGIGCLGTAAIFYSTRANILEPRTRFFFSLLCFVLAGFSFFPPPFTEYGSDSYSRLLHMTHYRYERRVASASWNIYSQVARSRLSPPHKLHEWPKVVLSQDTRETLKPFGFFSVSPSLPGPKFNRIVVVTIESLALEYLHHFNSKIPVETTPNLNQLVAGPGVMTNLWTTMLPSDEGLYSTMFSRPVYDPFVAHTLHLPSVVQVFGAHGFETGWIRGTTAFFNDAGGIYRALFQPNTLVGQEELHLKHQGRGMGAWGYHDGVVVNEVVEYLDRMRNRPTFLVATLIDTHPPYSTNWESEKYFPPTVVKSPLLRSLYWVDAQIGKLLQGLDDRKLMDDQTLVFITADHSPNHGAYLDWVTAKNYNPARIPGFWLSKRTLGIPLSEISSQLDIAPTLLGITGISIPKHFWGRDLRAPHSQGIAVSSEEGMLKVRTDTEEFFLNLSEVENKRTIASESKTERAALEWMQHQIAETSPSALREYDSPSEANN